MSEYGQFCPVAKAAELLDQRWTLLVLRELLSGSERFNDIRRGVPRMSPTLLSRRLRELCRAGIVERGTDGHYRLTAAGEELRPTIESLGQWGIRWIAELGDVDLDPHLLVWDMHRRVALARLPAGRTVLHLHFPDARPARASKWWLLMTREGVDVCDFDPGFDVTASLRCPLRTMVQVWRGDISWTSAQQSGDLVVSGAVSVRRELPSWLQLSVFAATARS